MREITGATIRQKGGPFLVEKLFLDEPRPDEVLVRIVATGMCHTDMVARDQLYDVPLPIVLGHEGAGVVESIGAGVAHAGVPSIQWIGLNKTLIAIVASPTLGLILAMAIMLATSWLGIHASARGAERTFRGLHLLSSFTRGTAPARSRD